MQTGVLANPFAAMLLSLLSVPIGFITWWSGFISGIPDGWTLCDGTQNTPDLRDKFVVGAQNTYIPGATGGTVQHVHDFTGTGHWHTMSAGPHLLFPGAFHPTTDIVSAIGTTDLTNNLPTWYALAYVMYTGP